MGALRREGIPYHFLDLSIDDFDVSRLIKHENYLAVATGGLVTTFMDAERILTEIEEAFRLMSDPDEDCWWDKEKAKTAQRGLDLFAQYFAALWW